MRSAGKCLYDNLKEVKDLKLRGRS